MINEFWSLVVETWEQGIRGVGVDDIIICLVIVIAWESKIRIICIHSAHNLKD